MNLDLAARTKSALRAAGWIEGRATDIDEARRLLAGRGLSLNEPAERFLREFHGLHMVLPEGGLSFVHFDIREILKFLEDGEVCQLESIIKESLSPVGRGGGFFIFVAASGRVILLHDEWLLYLVVQNVSDALNVITDRQVKGYETVWIPDEQQFSRPDPSGDTQVPRDA